MLNYIFSQIHKERLRRLTLLVCAGGQSSSRTPNVTPAGVFFTKVFLLIPAMPIFQAPLSRGGLDSSDSVNAHKLAVGG